MKALNITIEKIIAIFDTYCANKNKNWIQKNVY